MAGKPTVFGEDAAKRIASATKRVEAQPYDFTGQGKGPRNWNPGVVDAIVATPITAATSTHYGTGSASIVIDDPDDPDAFMGDPVYTDQVTVKNFGKTTGTIPTGTHIMIGWRNGKWRLISRDCP